MIVIAPYSPEWPLEFSRLAAPLAAALGELAVRIDHIGSTAVPGLAAKDVIDIQVTGSRPDQVAAEVDTVVAKIRADIRRRELAAGVRGENFVRVITDPPVPRVYFNDGDRRRALFGALTAGILATALGVSALERRRTRRTHVGTKVQRVAAGAA